MENHLLSEFRKAVKHWWISLVIGILALIIGIWCLFTPFTTFAALTIVFVISFFIGGISEIIFAVCNRDVMRNWGWTLAMGIIDVIFGIILLSNMAIAPIMLCYIIAFWMMLQSIWAIGMSIDMQPIKGSGWGWLLVLSILGLFASFLLLFQPAVTGLFAAYIISFGFIAYGILRIYMAFKLKEINKYLPKSDEK